MFPAVLFTTAKIWRCLSINKQIRKMWYVYTMDYYIAIKRDELLPWGMFFKDGFGCWEEGL